MNWKLLGCLVLAWIIVYACIVKGVQSSGKVGDEFSLKCSHDRRKTFYLEESNIENVRRGLTQHNSFWYFISIGLTDLLEK